LEPEESLKIQKGTAFAVGRVKNALNRISALRSSDKVDYDSIWEAYYDLEEAILVLKLAFSDFNKPGELRKLPGFVGLSEAKVRAALRSIEEHLISAETILESSRGVKAIEELRASRDILKAMLLVKDREWHHPKK
jgi:hypothetical protein